MQPGITIHAYYLDIYKKAIKSFDRGFTSPNFRKLASLAVDVPT